MKRTFSQFSTNSEPLPPPTSSETKLRHFIKSKKTRILLKKRGIKTLFPIQVSTYAYIYAKKDLIARDRTGSGKTLAYALPLTERGREEGWGGGIGVLVLLPTRELSIQVTGEMVKLMHKEGEFKVTNVYGGTEIQPQIASIKRGCDVLVGTPGRILDLQQRKVINYSSINTVVLDEADQMLDMGFQDTMEAILDEIKKANESRKIQILLFSATLPHWIHEISKKYISEDRMFIDLVKNSEIKTAKTVQHLAVNVPYHMRTEIIGDIVLCYGNSTDGIGGCRTIIFTETKQEANDVMLKAKINQECQLLHGDIPQKQREINYQGFRDGKFKCLIATNIAARGLDIPQIDLIVQLDPPKDVETYIHRSGRTARAGRDGACITFYTKKQVHLIERIEKKANISFKRVGIPQPSDILAATLSSITHSLFAVPPSILPLFNTAANSLLSQHTPEDALSRALALISGYKQDLKQRSLICGFEGWITVKIESEVEFRSSGFIWSFLKKNLGPEVIDRVKGMRLYKNRKGAVTDVGEEFYEQVCNIFQGNRTFTCEKATELPELMEEGVYVNDGNNNFNNNNSYNNGGNGGNGHGNGYGNGNGNGASNGFGNGASNGKPKPGRELEVFVGRMPLNLREEDIKKYFKEKGVEAERVMILYSDPEKRTSRGIAFVMCKNEEEVKKAVLLDGDKIMGKALKINRASDKPQR